MRFSAEKKQSIDDVKASAKHAALFEAVERDIAPEERVCMLLLVGGADREHALLRHAQAPLRFDARPSCWSHAALIADWRGGWSSAQCIEVTHDPDRGWRHEPELNAVTGCSLARYADARRYPHLAVVAVGFKQSSLRYRDPKSARAAVLKAALEPNLDRDRFPLWRALGPWRAYFHDQREACPLDRGVPIPSAAFCQYAFEAAGVDVMPAANAPGACPELIWASALRWTTSMDVDVRVWRTSARETSEHRDRSLAARLPGLAALRDALVEAPPSKT